MCLSLDSLLTSLACRFLIIMPLPHGVSPSSGTRATFTRILMLFSLSLTGYWLTLLCSGKTAITLIIFHLTACLSTNVQSAFLSFCQFIQSCLIVGNPKDCRTPGFPVHHQLPELAQTHVHRVGDAIQQSRPLSSPSPPAFNLSQHQSLFQWVASSRQVVKVSERQLQHQSFQWILRTDFF